MNPDLNIRLHSHDVKYSGGRSSGQQSVTGTTVVEDVNSHWIVKGRTGSYCGRGEPIRCGGVIRLMHLTSNKNLHSHYVPAPLSRNLHEVSAYSSKKGDGGDNWEVNCPLKHWQRDHFITLKHLDTDSFLTVTAKTYGDPISGQYEVATIRQLVGFTRWKVAEGVYLHQPEALHNLTNNNHFEL